MARSSHAVSAMSRFLLGGGAFRFLAVPRPGRLPGLLRLDALPRLPDLAPRPVPARLPDLARLLVGLPRPAAAPRAFDCARHRSCRPRSWRCRPIRCRPIRPPVNLRNRAALPRSPGTRVAAWRE